MAAASFEAMRPNRAAHALVPGLRGGVMTMLYRFVVRDLVIVLGDDRMVLAAVPRRRIRRRPVGMDRRRPALRVRISRPRMEHYLGAIMSGGKAEIGENLASGCSASVQKATPSAPLWRCSRASPPRQRRSRSSTWGCRASIWRPGSCGRGALPGGPRRDPRAAAAPLWTRDALRSEAGRRADAGPEAL